jgi:hypothetical protein
MDLVRAIVLAIVQGLSEFLPISSSGHLILIPHFLGWSDQGLAFDVAVHVGTLLALLAYFHRQLGTMATAWLDSVLRRQHTRDGDILLFRNRKRRMSPIYPRSLRIASMRAARMRSAMIGPASRASTCGSSLTAAAAARACRSKSACG